VRARLAQAARRTIFCCWHRGKPNLINSWPSPCLLARLRRRHSRRRVTKAPMILDQVRIPILPRFRSRKTTKSPQVCRALITVLDRIGLGPHQASDWVISRRIPAENCERIIPKKLSATEQWQEFVRRGPPPPFQRCYDDHEFGKAQNAQTTPRANCSYRHVTMAEKRPRRVRCWYSRFFNHSTVSTLTK